MQESLDTSLIRIRSADGGVIGAGFLVGERQILTCAHVVSQACGLSSHLLDVPQGVISLDFPLISPRTLFTAKVIQWCPLLADGRGDIAGLELQSEPPAGTEVVRFAPAEDMWEHAFRAFGFPTGYDDGVWATGRLLGRQATDWVMIEDVKAQGFAVGPGFSGTPVWDTQLQGVVGMVVAASRPTETKAAFVIPLDVLAATWPLIELVTRQRVFLSAAPADTAFATRLRDDLEERGIVVWKEQQTPSDGQATQEERVRQAIRAAQAVVLVVSSQTRSSRTVNAYLRMADLYQRRLILVWVGEDERPPLHQWRETIWIDTHSLPYAALLDAIEANLSQRRSISALLGPSEMTAEELRNPYKGLRAFREDDAEDFFGRDRLVDELVKDVERLLAVQVPTHDGKRLLPIIGPSGSGKSSVMMAGLLPRLKQGALPGSKDWVYLEPMIPGKHPIEALGLTLKPGFPETSFKSLREDLEDDAARGLHVLAKQLAQQPGDRVVLFIDQFEELFTQTVPEDERRSFIELLLTAVTESRGPLIVLLTLRADFYDRPMQYAKLGQLIKDNHKAIFPMEVGDLRAVIEQPAALPDVQLTFEGNLVGDLLFDAGGEVGALPLLEFTLDQLFQRREGHRLTLSAYQEIGRVKGALAKHAEATYAQLPSDEHRKMARALFLRLIDPGTTEQDSTRRRAALSELELPNPEQTAMMREVADAFIITRLLTTNEVAGNTTIEVSHEALIREWKRLTEWLREAREDIVLQQAIAADAAEWQHRGRSSDRLYRGIRLTEVQAWAERNTPSRNEVAFIEAAVAERQRQEEQTLQQKLREASLQRRVVTNQRWLISALSVFSAVLIVLSSVLTVEFQLAMANGKEAQKQAVIARSQAIAFAANNAMSQNKFDLGLLLSIEANRIRNTYEAQNSLLSALEKSSQLVTVLHSPYHNSMLGFAFGPTSSGLLVSNDHYSVYIWKKIRSIPDVINIPGTADIPSYIGGMALSPDGQSLAISSAAGVWRENIQTGSQVPLDGKEDSLPPNGAQPATPITFSADGKLVSSARCDHYADTHCTSTKISTWYVATNQLVGPPHSIPTNVDTAIFNPQRKELATINGAYVQFWNVITGAPLREIPTDSAEAITGMAFSLDGTTLATIGKAGIQLWNVSKGLLLDSLFIDHTDLITGVAISLDGSRLAVSSLDKTVLLWDRSSGKQVTLTGDPQPKWGVAFSPDGTMLASGSEYGTILIWNPFARSIVSRQVVTTSILKSLIFSPDGTVVFTGSQDGKVYLYDAKVGTSIGTLSTNSYPFLTPKEPVPDAWRSWIVSLAVGGDKLAVGRLDGTIALWDIKTRQPLPKPFTYPDQLGKVMLSADGQILAAAGSGDTILLWNVASGASLSPITYHNPIPQSTLLADLSPDGKSLAVGGCGKVVNYGCVGGQVLLWDVANGSKRTYRTLSGHNQDVYDVAFSPDGQTLASSSSDGIILWDVAQAKERSKKPLFAADPLLSYNTILFSQDGKRLVSYNSPAEQFGFALWELTEQPPGLLGDPFHEDSFNGGSLAISPDGQRLASVSASAQGGIFALWDFSLASLQARACSIANRNLTQVEWDQYVKSGTRETFCSDVAT
jgi:WD40 repeat protein